MGLSKIANMLSIDFQGQDLEVTGFSTDSRSIKKGELFIALKGDKFDGHQYIQQAQERGACAALVSDSVVTNLPLLKVADTHQGLLDLAKAWRAQFNLPVIAVTGSCGKTSTRGLLQSIFSVCGDTLASERSYNNSIGVPLTLLRLRSQHKFAVIEIGANHIGEIAELVQIVKPDVAIITNAGPSHLEGFGSLQGVATAKSEIFSSLNSSGIAIINTDDEFADYWHKKIGSQKTLTFGLKNSADVYASENDIVFNADVMPMFTLQTPIGEVVIKLPLMGKHNVYNALAASAAATALQVPLSKIKIGLENAVAENRRLVRSQGYAEATIIDDSYNANPSSVGAAIDVLAKCSGTAILVLGDMLELGDNTVELHRQIGAKAQSAGIKYLFCFGEHSKNAAETFGERGQHFSDQQMLVSALRPLLNSDVTVLIKGSNSMGMNQVTQLLINPL